MVAFLRLPFTSWHALQTLNLARNSRSVLGSGMTSAECAGAASAARTTRTPKTVCVRKNFLPRLGVVGELNYSPRNRAARSPGLLCQPRRARIRRAACNVHTAAAQFDEEEHVQVAA